MLFLFVFFSSSVRVFSVLFGILHAQAHIHCIHTAWNERWKEANKRKRERMRSDPHMCRRVHALVDAQATHSFRFGRSFFRSFVRHVVCVCRTREQHTHTHTRGSRRLHASASHDTHSNYSRRMSFRNQLNTSNEASKTCFWLVLQNNHLKILTYKTIIHYHIISTYTQRSNIWLSFELRFWTKFTKFIISSTTRKHRTTNLYRTTKRKKNKQNSFIIHQKKKE